MRLMSLYLRSRSLTQVLGSLTAVAVIGWLMAEHHFTSPARASGVSLEVPILTLMPLIAALIIGVSTYTPFGELEATSSRSLPLLRLSHLALLLVWAGLALLPSAPKVDLVAAEVTIVRNLVGLTGMACFGAWLLGSRLSWILPLAYITIAATKGLVIIKQQAVWAWWVWPLQAGDNGLALALAIGSAMVGLGVLCCFGPTSQLQGNGWGFAQTRLSNLYKRR